MRRFNNLCGIEKAFDFHPFYAEFKEQNFDTYFAQTFIRSEDMAKIEIVFTDGINLTPETFTNGRYITKDTALIDGKEIKISRKPIVNLNFISIGNEELRKQGRGSDLLKWFVGICDKYDYECWLEMDTQFGLSLDVLSHFYEKFDFVRVDELIMKRHCKSNRSKIYNTDDISEQLYLIDSCDDLIDTIVTEYITFDDKDFGDKKNAEAYRERIRNYTNSLQNTFKKIVPVLETEETVSYMNLYSLYSAVDGVLAHLESFEDEYDIEDDMNDFYNFKAILESKLEIN